MHYGDTYDVDVRAIFGCNPMLQCIFLTTEQTTCPISRFFRELGTGRGNRALMTRRAHRWTLADLNEAAAAADAFACG